MSEHERATFFGRLRKGMQDSIAYSKGKLTLKTTEIPAPPPKAGAREITSLRKKLKMSQAVFAATLNISSKTVQSWEQGLREPSDAALRMIQLIRLNPDLLSGIFSMRANTRHARNASGNWRQQTSLRKKAI